MRSFFSSFFPVFVFSFLFFSFLFFPAYSPLRYVCRREQAFSDTLINKTNERFNRLFLLFQGAGLCCHYAFYNAFVIRYKLCCSLKQ